jgi:hypothetical protein
MSPTAVVLIVAAAGAFPLLLWAIGRAVTVTGERAPYSPGRKQYLAGRLYGVRISALIDGSDELLVSLTAPATDDSQAARPLIRCSASQPASVPWPGSGAGGMKARSFALTSATTAPSCSPTPRWAAMPPASQPPPSPGRTVDRQSLRISHHLTTANRLSSAMVPPLRR